MRRMSIRMPLGQSTLTKALQESEGKSLGSRRDHDTIGTCVLTEKDALGHRITTAREFRETRNARDFRFAPKKAKI